MIDTLLNCFDKITKKTVPTNFQDASGANAVVVRKKGVVETKDVNQLYGNYVALRYLPTYINLLKASWGPSHASISPPQFIGLRVRAQKRLISVGQTLGKRWKLGGT